MTWAIRWVGMWIIVAGASSVLANWRQVPTGSFENLYLFSACPGAVVILIGLGIRRQMRLAFIGALAVVPVALAWNVGTAALWRSGSMIPLASAATAVLVSAVQWRLIWAIRRRGEAAGMVHPLRPGRLAVTGNCESDGLAILVRGVGYLQLAVAASLGLRLALPFLIPHPGFTTLGWDLYSTSRPSFTISGWDLHNTAFVATTTIKGLLGLALLFRQRTALLALAAVIPLASALEPVATFLIYRGIPDAASVTIAVNLVYGTLLYRLYRRTASSPTAS